MLEVKTADLIGPALDWAVKQAIGAVDEPGHIVQFPDWHPTPWMMGVYKPSTEWDHGGELIERYRIDLAAQPYSGWTATTDECDSWIAGDTPLIAACRAIVAAKLGDTVQIPEELA